MADSVVREGLCSKISGSRASMWPRQWFMGDYLAESVVHEGFFCSHEIAVIKARNIITNTCERYNKLRNVNVI